MKQTRKIVALLLCLCLCMAFFAACGKSESGTTPSATPSATTGGSEAPSADNKYDASDKVIIPVLTQLNSSLGESIKCSAGLAKQELEAKGAFGGRSIEFEWIEVGTDQQASITASQKAASIDDVNAIIGFYKSQWQIAANDIFLAAEIPTFCLGNSVAVSEMGNPYVWCTRALDKYPSAALADVAVDTVGLKNPGIIYFTNASGMSQYEYTLKRLQERGIEKFAIELTFEDSTVTDFTSIITQLKGSDADGVIMYTTGGEDGYLLASQLHDQGYDKPVVTCVAMMAPTTINNVSGGLEGNYGVTECSTARETYNAYYENVMKMEGWPADYYPAWTDCVLYDSLYILAAAYEKVGSCAPAALNEGLAQIELGDVTGTMYDYYSTEEHCFGHQMCAAQIVDGKVVAGDQFFVN